VVKDSRDGSLVAVLSETHEGLADFPAAGRTGHIMGLIASGASIMEAKELARHADIQQTAKYNHIGMQARAAALTGLQYPMTCEPAELLEIRWISGGVLGQEVSAGDNKRDRESEPENEKPPSGEGVSSFHVTASQERAVDVSSGGSGNCTRVPFDATSDGSCGYEMRPEGWPEHGRESEALRELVANWHRLSPEVRGMIMELVRTSQKSIEDGLGFPASGGHPNTGPGAPRAT
jgi:hypothetical protein